MTKKNLTVGLLLLFCCVTCLAQTALRSPIQPGVDKRNDAEKALLGEPLRSVGPSLFEYRPPAGFSSFLVQYREGSDIVERVEMNLPRALARDGIIQELKLPEAPDAKTVDSQGRLLEFFGSPAFMVLVHPSTEVSSGVNSLGYYSPEFFTAVVGNLAKSSTPTPVSKPSLSGEHNAQPVMLAGETEFRVKLLNPLNTRTSKKGDKITSQVLEPEQFRGDILEGTVLASKSGGKVKGKSVLNFSFDTLNQAGEALPVRAEVKSITNSKKQQNVDEEGQIIHKKNNLGKVAAGAAVGALIGGLVGGAKGAAIGAGVGAGASLVFVELIAEGANVSFAPGSEFVLSVKPDKKRKPSEPCEPGHISGRCSSSGPATLKRGKS